MYIYHGEVLNSERWIADLLYIFGVHSTVIVVQILYLAYKSLLNVVSALCGAAFTLE